MTTTVTTIAGFIPLLISGGVFWQPLAIAITGGISGSSLLALYFVPAVYLMIKNSDRSSLFYLLCSKRSRSAYSQLP
ncbi:MAG: efflux RND transporter permease subunit [Cyanobacteria bacterium J06598_4]